MPEYLAPGVFVEEVSFRSKSIEGVSTTTTGFIGPTRYGPLDGELEVITSLTDFTRLYGDGQPLEFATASGGVDRVHNYVWHAARTFFEQGGKRLYVRRVFRPASSSDDGHAEEDLVTGLTVRARFPGRSGVRRVRLTLSMGPNILSATSFAAPNAAHDPDNTRVSGLQENDIVAIFNRDDRPAGPNPPPPDPPDGVLYRAVQAFTTDGRPTWQFVDGPAGGDATIDLADLRPDADPVWTDEVRVITAGLRILPAEEGEPDIALSGLPIDPRHRLGGQPDSLFTVFDEHDPDLARARSTPIYLRLANTVTTGLQVLGALFATSGLEDALLDPTSSERDRSVECRLGSGNDGARPGSTEYAGDDDDPDDRAGLKALEDVEDISIVAAPGSSFRYESGFRAEATTIANLLIGHAERMRYRIAVLDSGNGQSIAQVSTMRAGLDSKHAALYYPWVRVLDPITRQEINLPPSGFVAGIYARNDVERAVFKAPANEVVTGALGFETMLNRAQQEVLNPLGVNCFRYFEGRGNRLWGARTISSDPEWKYVNLRRYFAYLERSIDRGTQWAVFEPNGEQLWGNVRRTISDFLLNEFQMGALLGDKPDKAYFVKCDRSTMTQNDLDNGRLVVLIGVAALRPAEFVIFRIGQWTADRKV